MFLFEMHALGTRFALARLLIDIPGIILIAFVLRAIIPAREVARLYAAAESAGTSDEQLNTGRLSPCLRGPSGYLPGVVVDSQERCLGGSRLSPRPQRSPTLGTIVKLDRLDGSG